MTESILESTAYQIKNAALLAKKKIRTNLKNVHETLLLPLWGRAEAAKMKDPVLNDRKAIELINHIDYDFSKFRSQIRKFEILTLAMRAKELDAIIREFINVHPEGTIVNIGAGLDTTFYRVNNGQIKWYDLDVSQVIDLRNTLLPQSEQLKSISKSMFDESFLVDIEKPKDGILFFASGVLIYFEEERVRAFFKMIASHFPHSEIAFDTMTPLGIYIAGKIVKKSGIQGADMKWGIPNVRRMQQWNLGLELVEHYPIYSKTVIPRSWGVGTKLLMRFSDLFSIVNMNYVKFN